nr:hypothetical protein [Rhodococcus sp. 06-621-2]
MSSDYNWTGIDARRGAHEALADVPAVTDDRIEQLLQRTLELLDTDA